MSMFTVAERTYLTLEGRPTTNELEANELLANGGDEIPMERAVALGLVAGGAAGHDASTSAPETPAEPSKDDVMAAYARELKKAKADDVRAMAAAQSLSTEGNADAVRSRLMEAYSAAYDAEHAEGAAAGETGEQGGDPDPDVVDE